MIGRKSGSGTMVHFRIRFPYEPTTGWWKIGFLAIWVFSALVSVGVAISLACTIIYFVTKFW